MFRVFCCFALLASSGCASQTVTQTKQPRRTPQEMYAQQIDRTGSFDALVGRGVIEFHWSDEEGKHRAQGDFDFWRLGNAISLRISKGSEPLMWIGGDAQNHWMFDMLGDETKLSINQKDVIFSDVLDTLVLLGLAPLPEGKMTVEKGVVTVEANERMWIATFDPTTHRPLEIEIIHGKQQTTALHRSGIKVELLNRNRLVWPETGKLIDIESSTTNTNVKIDFAWISTDTSEERMDRVFDLAFLRKALKPTVIEELQQ